MSLIEHADTRHFREASTEYTSKDFTYLVTREEDANGNFIAYVVTDRNGKLVGTPVRGEAQADVAIQRAIDNISGKGLVRLGTGSFLISATVKPKAGVIVSGLGEGTYVKIADGTDDYAFTVPTDSDNARVEAMHIDGNKANQSSGGGVKVLGYNWRVILQYLTFRDCKDHGIAFTSNESKYTYEPILFDIDVKGSDSDGISFGWCADLWGADVYSEGNGGNGISFYDAAGTVYHPHAYNNYGDCGMYVDSVCKDLRLLQPHLDTNQKDGAIIKGGRITLLTPFAFNNSQTSGDTYDGIVISDASNVNVIGSVCCDTQSTKTQRYGINEEGTSDYNIITSNQCGGNATGGITTVGTNTVTANNIT